MEIIIIGTNPPCPRCDLLGLMVDELLKKTGIEGNVRRIVRESVEAHSIAAAAGRKIGTSDDVSVVTGVKSDMKALAAAVMAKSENLEAGYRPADLWSPAFDKALAPISEAAEAAGYYVTPVLVIDGEVLMSGRVPEISELEKWITERAV